MATQRRNRKDWREDYARRMAIPPPKKTMLYNALEDLDRAKRLLISICDAATPDAEMTAAIEEAKEWLNL